MNAVEQLRALLDIQDEKVRHEAIEAFWGTLSDEEKEEIRQFVVNSLSVLTELFAKLVKEELEKIIPPVNRDQL